VITGFSGYGDDFGTEMLTFTSFEVLLCSERKKRLNSITMDTTVNPTISNKVTRVERR
jgi:hypothetical protein